MTQPVGQGSPVCSPTPAIHLNLPQTPHFKYAPGQSAPLPFPLYCQKHPASAPAAPSFWNTFCFHLLHVFLALKGSGQVQLLWSHFCCNLVKVGLLVTLFSALHHVYLPGVLIFISLCHLILDYMAVSIMKSLRPSTVSDRPFWNPTAPRTEQTFHKYTFGSGMPFGAWLKGCERPACLDTSGLTGANVHKARGSPLGNSPSWERKGVQESLALSQSLSHGGRDLVFE